MATELERLREENEFLRLRVQELEGLLLNADLPPSLGLSRTAGRVLSLLLARTIVTKEAVMTALYSIAVEDPPDDKIVAAFIFSLRRKLAPHGVAIHSKVGRGAPGYWITNEDKAKVRALS